MNISKCYLNQAYRLDEFIRSNQRELEDLKELSITIKGFNTEKDKVQEGNSSTDAKYVDIVNKMIDLERMIEDDLNRLFDLKMEIRTIVNAVKNTDERLLLKLKYVNFLSWEGISKEMNMSIRNIHRIHNSALNNVEIPKYFRIN